MRSPKASASWLWDDLKYSFGVTSSIEIRPGWSLTCHPLAYRCAYFAQQDDPEQVAEFDAFIKSATENMVLFDIGAHFGLFSLAALHYGGPKARALAVDPSPVAAKFLRIQSALNNVDERLTVVQAAVTDCAGWHDMVPTGVIGSGYYVSPDEAHSSSDMHKTRACTIDGLAAEFDMKPTHIKIDVEGYEAAVLRGASEALAGEAAPVIFLEVHNEIVRNLGNDPGETLEVLREAGYETFSMDEFPIGAGKILAQPLLRIIAKRKN